MAAVARALDPLKAPLPHQQYIYDVAFEINPETGLLAYDDVTFVGPRQVSGKAIASITPMLTSRGWVPMSDIQVGDHGYHPDGHLIEVLAVSDEMPDHDCYRVTTSDGRSVVADAGHLWRVKDTFTGTRVWKTLTTAQIAAAGLRNRGGSNGWRWRLPIQQAVKSPSVTLPLDPYFFGLWLGDGTSANSSLTVGNLDIDHVRSEIMATGLTIVSEKQCPTGSWALWISSPRRERACTVPGCAEMDVSRGLCRPHYKRATRLGALPPKLPMDTPSSRLRNLGVIRNKHVPDVYLYAGHDQRLALLQGLMDSDGYISAHQGSVEFVSTKRALADAVTYLARSLGWRAAMHEGVAKLNGRVIGPKWRVTWTPVVDGPSPFRLPRKVARLRPVRSHKGELNAVSIASIESVPSRPVKCIKVDSPDGLFLAGRDLVATHNSEALLPVMVHRCTGFGPELAAYARREFGLDVPEPGPQKVLYTAQRAEDARQKWRDVHLERIRKSPMRAMWSQPPRLRLAAEAMFWQNGSMWAPGSTSGKTAGTGDTLDLGVIDEMWAQEDGRTEVGMRPTMLTRPWRQLWRASMVPGLSRVAPEKWAYMRQKMAAGRARVEADVRHKNAYFEWSLSEDQDPTDEDNWWTCMPALGYTVPVENVRSDYQALELVDFCAEYLGWWPTGAMPLWSTISEQTWRDLFHGGRYQEPMAIGVDATPELTAASIGMAAECSDGGDIHVELIDRRAGVNWVVEAILSLCRSQPVCAIGIDRNGPLAGIVRPLTRAAEEQNLDVTVVGNGGQGLNSAEVSAACAQLYNETGEHDDDDPDAPAPTLRRVRHIGQAELDTAVGGAVKHYHGDRWRWDRVGSAVDVSPLYSITLARAAGEAEEWIGGAYDVRKSLG